MAGARVYKEEMYMATLRYLGHSAFEIRGKDTVILIDPFLSGNPAGAAARESEFTDVRYIFVTHGHGDHLGDT